MCTVLLDFSPSTAWPILVAANRDERLGRAFDAPARHWPDRPDLLAPRDRDGGGTWMALRDDGFLAVLLNRPQTLGSAEGRETRGTIPLIALAHDSPAAAARALADEPADRWRPCNVLLASPSSVVFVELRGHERPPVIEDVPEGRHLFSAGSRNDPRMPRLRHVFPRFLHLARPDPDAGGDPFAPWRALLASRERSLPDDPLSALNVRIEPVYGTTSSSILAIPAHPGTPPVWTFASAAPDSTPFAGIDTVPLAPGPDAGLA